MSRGNISMLVPALLLLEIIHLAQAMYCQPGTFKDGGSCKPCPEGTISIMVNAAKCEECPVRTLPNSERTACDLCPPGNFISAADGFNCIPCEIGKYNPETGASDCIICPEGRVTFAIGAKSVLQCGNCPKGFFLLFGPTDVSCTFCPIGRFSDEENATFCKRCPIGKFSHVGSPKCTGCPPGTFGISGPDGEPGCKMCPSGTYQNLEGQTKCLPCPKNSVSVGSRKKCRPTCESDATDCRSCPPGKGFMGGECKPCSMDTVSTGRTATGCHPCPSGLLVNEGRTTCVCPDDTGFIDGACRECPFNARVVNNVKCECKGDFLLRKGGCLCPSGSKPVGLKCVACTAAERTELIEEFRGPCEFCDAGQFWNEKEQECQPCPLPFANPTRNFARSCSVH